MAFKVGLIGLEGHHGVILEGILRHEDSVLSAVTSRNEMAIRLLKGHRAVTDKTTFYHDYRQMLREEDLDIVGVCNVNADHAEAIEACARAGANVIAEKPLATTLEDLNRVREIVGKSDVKATMLLTMRFEPAYKRMREIIMNGEIGEPVLATAQKSYRLGIRPDWMKRRESFGGTIPFIGIHMLDLIRWTTGKEFVEGMAYHSNVAHPEIGEMEDNASILLKLDNNGTATVRLDYLRPMSAPTHGDDRLRIAGSKGVIEATENGLRLTLIAPSKGVVELEIPEKDYLYLDFVESIEQGRKPRASFEEACKATEISLKLRDSADRGQKVSL
jgi:predicted dehydrogenase